MGGRATTDSSTGRRGGGGYADLWRAEASRRARVTLLAVAGLIAALFIALFVSEIGQQGEWNRTRVLCVGGVVVNTCWFGYAACCGKPSSRLLMLYICPGFILNCILVAVAIGLPYY